MDVEELKIQKIAVFHGLSYYQSFVYVEVQPDKPIGIYKYEQGYTEKRIQESGYFSEEYGLFQGIPITRACYDDGAAVLNGVVVDTSGAELRVRYLSRYNFLVASKYSPINSQQFDRFSRPLLHEMLQGKDHMKELCDVVQHMPRHKNDD